MKNKFNSYVVTVAVLLSFSSCVKQVDQAAVTPPTTTNSAENFAEIKASGSFNWSTSNIVNFSFAGSADQDVKLILKVMDADNNVLLQKLQKGNENFSASVVIPAHMDKMNVSFGSTSQTFDCKSGTVTMTIK